MLLSRARNKRDVESHVRGIKGVDAGVVGSLDMLDPSILVQRPGLPPSVTVGHAPKNDPRVLQARVSEVHYHIAQ
jgi:hypothetical protein